jgi:hypothetical protein
VAETAHRLGITSPLDSVHSIGLGVTNVTPLELAHAYATIAARGRRVGGSLLFRPRDSAIRDPSMDPISILRVDFPGTRKDDVNAPRTVQAVPEGHALAAVDAMRGVTRYGTGRRASLGRRVTVGKTGYDLGLPGRLVRRLHAAARRRRLGRLRRRAEAMETEWDGEPVSEARCPRSPGATTRGRRSAGSRCSTGHGRRPSRARRSASTRATASAPPTAVRTRGCSSWPSTGSRTTSPTAPTT